MHAPALELVDLRRDFARGLLRARRTALAGVSLRVERGARLGLVGPNGSGKSTLLRLAAGADRPSAGALKVFGEASGPRTRARVGYLPEDSPFPPELTGRAALDLLGSLQGLSGGVTRRRGAELLERVGLAAAARTPLGRYSRGMLRRFGLAQAWLHEPELLLLDEPTAGLDAQGFEVLDALLDEARTRGATVVLSSHLIGDLQRRCDELAVLVDGGLVAHGPAAELLARPGCWRLEVEHLDAAALDALEAWVAAHGGRVTERAPSGRTLFELYREAAPRA